MARQGSSLNNFSNDPNKRPSLRPSHDDKTTKFVHSCMLELVQNSQHKRLDKNTEQTLRHGRVVQGGVVLLVHILWQSLTNRFEVLVL